MKASVNFDWRKKDDPDQPAELVIHAALKAAGYTVERAFVQGSWDEDKPRIPGNDHQSSLFLPSLCGKFLR